MNLLNPEEKEILENVEQGEWQSIDNLSEEIQQYETYANHQINQLKIEIILSVEDTKKIKEISQEFGKSIANLSQEILHKYLKGELIERK